MRDKELKGGWVCKWIDHAMDVWVPDIVEMEWELGSAASNFGALPCFDPFSIFESQNWAVVK